MKKGLFLLVFVLPLACLAWKWPALPPQVPLHFSRDGADVLGPKWVLGLLALLPLLLYVVLPRLRPARPGELFYRQAGVGLALLGSLALSAWFVAMPTAG